MWVTSTAMTELGPYSNEYNTVLSMNEGKKFDRLLKYVDTARGTTFLGR